ncbi:hypothetical protein N5C43_16430 [Comamonas terrigena]|uniref:hypothetical protein n=1 Tax=Comamonas terrigena TaxID=32013 RepID=UPI00244C535B|nr:hypothetical protein [Comamonas terrigena]MDH1292832.1 hypothetical protein [Comamonas terrigena]
MSKDSIFCSKFMPTWAWIDDCLTMAEWSASWQIIGTIVGVGVGIATAIKIAKDISQIRESQVASDALNKSKYLIDLNRRIYDDEDLACVIEKIDNEDEILGDYEFSNKSRKLLAFFEEIQYLIDENLIKEKSAHHFFGYYAKKCFYSDIFWRCIQKDYENWRLYLKFVKSMGIDVDSIVGKEKTDDVNA